MMIQGVNISCLEIKSLYPWLWIIIRKSLKSKNTNTAMAFRDLWVSEKAHVQKWTIVVSRDFLLFFLLQCNYRIVSWDCSPWLAPRLTRESHHDIWTIFLTICLSFDNRDMTSHAKCDTGLAQTGVDWKCTDKTKLLIVHSAINQQL